MVEWLSGSWQGDEGKVHGYCVLVEVGFRW